MTIHNVIYAINLTAEDGEIVVRCRDLPELLTAGDDENEALELAEDALEVVLLGYMDDDRDVPAPTPAAPGEHIVVPSPTVAAKLAVWQAFRAAGISKSELGRRMGLAEGEIRRILDPNHRTKIERLDEAMHALGMRLIVSAEAA